MTKALKVQFYVYKPWNGRKYYELHTCVIKIDMKEKTEVRQILLECGTFFLDGSDFLHVSSISTFPFHGLVLLLVILIPLLQIPSAPHEYT